MVQVDFWRNGANDELRGAVRNDASLYTTTPWTTLADSAHVLEIDWRAATAPGANNGGLTLWIDGAQVGALSGVDNDTRRVDRARIGAIDLDVGTTGMFYLNAFAGHETRTSTGGLTCAPASGRAHHITLPDSGRVARPRRLCE